MKVSLVNQSSDFKLLVNQSLYKTTFQYPCSSVDVCTSYKFSLPRGAYAVSMCGGNGGLPSTFQKEGKRNPDTPYAAGCSHGIIHIDTTTTFFLTLGAHGEYGINTQLRAKGGFNGGGRGNINIEKQCSGGGGASDLRAEFNDIYHRIFVAGGGGGGDDLYGNDTPLTNDGRGGSGGGVVAQGWYQSNNAITFPVANETFGFSFGQGECSSSTGSKHPYGSKTSVPINIDVGGAGGGWFGGFASNSNSYGAGGGSSFALTSAAKIPTTTLEERNDDYSIRSTGVYAFLESNKYRFTNVVLERGVWYGNGFAEITSLGALYSYCSHSSFLMTHSITLFSIFVMNRSL